MTEGNVYSEGKALWTITASNRMEGSDWSGVCRPQTVEASSLVEALEKAMALPFASWVCDEAGEVAIEIVVDKPMPDLRLADLPEYGERTRLWMLDAKEQLAAVSKYEREHPAVEEGVPCFAKVERALIDAIEKASRYAIHAQINQDSVEPEP